MIREIPTGWWDIVDIAIVSLVIYECLKLIRRTRAVQVALGGGLVIGLYYASQFAPLQAVNWLIRDMFGYMVFAAIVLFQSDIRRTLAHFGRAPFFRYFGEPGRTGEAIEEMVTASTMLASQRVGAIIAIEREISLRNYIESGIPLDATLTYDLLLTVFQPGSPLHDGAVIVQEDRVTAAACFLPLTVNPRLGRELVRDTVRRLALQRKVTQLRSWCQRKPVKSHWLLMDKLTANSIRNRSKIVSRPYYCGVGLRSRERILVHSLET